MGSKPGCSSDRLGNFGEDWPDGSANVAQVLVEIVISLNIIKSMKIPGRRINRVESKIVSEKIRLVKIT